MMRYDRFYRCVRASGLALIAGLGFACGSDEDVTEGEPVGFVDPPPASTNWCKRMVAGPAGGDFRLDLSAAHGNLRFFGAHRTHREVDDALIAAMQGSDPWSEEALATYAQELELACSLPANEDVLGSAAVELVGEVAVIHPGEGSLSLPSGALAAAIDLRDLPAVDGLRDALDRAASVVLADDTPRPSLKLREMRGLVDEVYAPYLGTQNIYYNVVAEVEQESIPGGAASPLPLALITSDKLAPEAAQFAATLRYENRAWIVGEDVLTAVAEAQWLPVGQYGLLHRNRALTKGGDLPDIIPADLRTSIPLERMTEVIEDGGPPPITTSVSSRRAIEPFDANLMLTDDQHTIGDTRAALLLAHGAARLFFPYFPVVGDTIDDGLLAELVSLDDSTLDGLAYLLHPVQRLTKHLRDSHVTTAYLGDQVTSAAGYLPLLLDMTAEDEVVVRYSDLSDVQAGDILVAVDDVPIGEVMADLEERTTASNAGSLDRRILQLVTVVREPVIWTLRSPDETTDDVELDLSDTTTSPVSSPNFRTAGPLDDLGHPELYYLNLSGDVYDGTPPASQVIEDVQGAAGLIIDGRGYPGSTETWNLIERVLTESSFIRFRCPYVNALGATMNDSTQVWSPLSSPRYDGPVAVLVGPWTQSQAEHILIPLVNTGRADFVGRQTSGANGNITGVMLPGALGLLFTGLEVLYDDGSTFHGVGIQPTIEVHPTVEALSQGVDPELDAAIEHLTTD